MIMVENVYKKIGNNTILKNICFHCESQSIFGILGSNGAGKTSILRILNGLLHIDSGKVSVMGFNPYKDKHQIHKSCGISTEESKMYNQLSIIQNIEYYSGYFSDTLNDKEFNELISLLSIKEYLDKPYKTLSSGNIKKADLLRSLISKPRLVFWDEPFANLDPESVSGLISIIKLFNTTYKTTFFINSHDLYYCQKFCTHIGLIFNGYMIYTGSLEDLYKKYMCDNLEDAYFIAKESHHE